MEPDRFKAALARYGLDAEEAGVFFGASPRTGQRWAAGTTPVPGAVGMLFRLMDRTGVDADSFRQEFRDARRVAKETKAARYELIKSRRKRLAKAA